MDSYRQQIYIVHVTNSIQYEISLDFCTSYIMDLRPLHGATSVELAFCSRAFASCFLIFFKFKIIIHLIMVDAEGAILTFCCICQSSKELKIFFYSSGSYNRQIRLTQFMGVHSCACLSGSMTQCIPWDLLPSTFVRSVK